MWQKRSASAIVLSLILVCTAWVTARAEAQISGTEDKIVLRVKDATIAEILATVRSTLGIRIDLSGSTAHQISGTYAGSLRHVLAHLLDGEDFIITTVPTGMSITIVGSNGAGGGPGRFTRQRAGGDNESSPIQGWTPSQILPERPALTTTISTQSPSNVVDPRHKQTADTDEASPIQGWSGNASTGSVSTTASAQSPANPVPGAVPQSVDSEEPSPIQGWSGNASSDSASTMASSQSPANPVSGAVPRSLDSEEPSPVQGWAGNMEVTRATTN